MDTNEMKPNPRPNPRPEPEVVTERELDPRERAKLRAKEVLENNGGDLDDGTDDFKIDRDIIPDGWAYEWKTYSVMGAVDPAYQVQLAKKGWEPVPASRHPELMPVGSTEKTITRKGLMLMERPLELVERARDIDKKRARDQVRFKEQQLTQAPAGQFERSNKDSPLVKVKKTVEAMEIPDA